MRRFSILAAGAALAIAVDGAAARRARPARPDANVSKVPFTLTEAGCDPAQLELPRGPDDVRGEERRRRRGDRDGDPAGRPHPRRGREPHARTVRFVQRHAAAGHVRRPCARTARRRAKGELVVSGAAVSTTTAPAGSSAATAVSRLPRVRRGRSRAAGHRHDRVRGRGEGGRRRRRRRSSSRRRAPTTRPSSPSPRASATSTPRSTRARTTCRPNEFKGFHRIEKQLWEEGNTDGMAPVADELLVNVKKLQALDPDDQARARADRERRGRAAERGRGQQDHRRRGSLLAHRPVGLRRQRRRCEAPRSRRCGRSSPPRTPTLADKIDQQFASTDDALDAVQDAGGGFVLYTDLTKAQTQGARRAGRRAGRLACRRSPPIVVAGKAG